MLVRLLSTLATSVSTVKFIPCVALISASMWYIVAAGAEFLEVISQFWLCQNPTPAAAAILTGVTFQPTSGAALNCMEEVVLHLNAHQVALVAAGAHGAWSCHALLRPAMYHFLKVQLEGLPDISARVAKLIRESIQDDPSS